MRHHNNIRSVRNKCCFRATQVVISAVKRLTGFGDGASWIRRGSAWWLTDSSSDVA
jgi:hypothetical protein